MIMRKLILQVTDRRYVLDPDADRRPSRLEVALQASFFSKKQS